MALLLTGPASAQMAPTRVHATVEKLDGERLQLIGADGKPLSIRLPESAVVVAATAITLAEVAPGSFIGTGALRQPDGSYQAMEVHVFPESMRGTGEGDRPWTAGPDSTMTNGTLGQVAGSDGRSLTIRYGTAEKTVQVPPDTPILAYTPGARDMLVPGTHVVVFATGDGASLVASRVTVGRNGIDLPG